MNNQYSEYSEREQSAYIAFAELFELKNPKPTSPLVEKENKWRKWGLRAIMIASLNVSAVHTVPFSMDSAPDYPVLRWLTGLSAFVMIELAIIILSFNITERYYKYNKEANPAKVGLYLKAGLGLVLLLAICANMYATYKSATNEPETTPISPVGDYQPVALKNENKDANNSSVAKIILFLLIGFSAPSLAYLTGDVLALQSVEQKGKERIASQQHKSELQDWHNTLNQAWVSQKGKGAWKVQEGLRPQLQERNQLVINDVINYSKRNRANDAKDTVRLHLRNYPEDMKKSTRLLGEQLGVSHNVVAQVKKEDEFASQQHKSELQD